MLKYNLILKMFINSFIHQFTVQQTGPPKITFSKRQFTIGENLVSNCTTSKAHPAPHITWLINGKQVRFGCFLLFLKIKMCEIYTMNVMQKIQMQSEFQRIELIISVGGEID